MNPHDLKNPYAEGLWSHNGGYPQELPVYIVTLDGTTYSAEAAVEHAAEAGWTPVPEAPTYDSDTQVLEWTGVEWLVRDLTEDEWSALKSSYAVQINKWAGDKRMEYITDIPGQQATYLAKAQEAKAYQDDLDPNPINYPYLAYEAAETGQDLAVVAAIVRATEQAWTQVNIKIEGKRRGALAKLDAAVAAKDKDAIKAIFPIQWP